MQAGQVVKITKGPYAGLNAMVTAVTEDQEYVYQVRVFVDGSYQWLPVTSVEAK